MKQKRLKILKNNKDLSQTMSKQSNSVSLDKRRSGLRTDVKRLFVRLKQHLNPTVYTSRVDRNITEKKRNHAILGIWLLLVVVSIFYSTSVIFIGVGTLESKIALIPQTVFALYTLIKAFSNLHK